MVSYGLHSVSLYTRNIAPGDLHFLAGRGDKSAYQEGVGDQARFGQIRDIITSPVDYPNKLWIVDQKPGCIRSLDRRTNRTSHFAGMCGFFSDVDGFLNRAQTGEVSSIIKDPHSDEKYYVYDSTYFSIKLLQYFDRASSWSLRRIVNLRPSSGRPPIVGNINFDFAGRLIYIFTDSGAWQYDPSMKTLSKGRPLLFYDGFDSLFLSHRLYLVGKRRTLLAFDLQTNTSKRLCLSTPPYMSVLHPLQICHNVGSYSGFLGMAKHPRYSVLFVTGFSKIFTVEYRGLRATISYKSFYIVTQFLAYYYGKVISTSPLSVIVV